MLRLVPYLQRNPGVTVEEVAEHFQVSEKDLLGDLEVLQFCGLPAGYVNDLFSIDVEATREDGMIFLNNAEVLSTPPRLSGAEATSLLVALEALREISADTEVVDSVIDKLRTAFGIAQEQVRITIAAGEKQHRQLLLEAIEDRRTVRLDYVGQRTRSQPVVEPAQLRAVDGFTYLDAWSRSRHAWRSYRLDRIRRVDPLEGEFTLREGLTDSTERWFHEATTHVTLSVRKDAAWIGEYYPVEAVETDGQNLRVTMPVGSREWFVGLILRLGDSVVDVSDPALARQAARAAQEALRNYGADLGHEGPRG